MKDKSCPPKDEAHALMVGCLLQWERRSSRILSVYEGCKSVKGSVAKYLEAYSKIVGL